MLLCMSLPVPVTRPTPDPPKETPAQQRALPVVGGVGAVGAVVGAVIAGPIWAGIAAGVSAVAALPLWIARRARRREQAAEHHRTLSAYKRLEEMTLAAYRQMTTDTLTKDELVRGQGFHPDEADWALKWLVAHDLIDTDWDEMEGPAVYRRTHAGVTPAAEPSGGTPAVSPARAAPPSALVEGPKNPTKAALLSLVVPGLGHVYSGSVLRGVGFLIASALAWPTIFGGPFVHLWNVFDAARTARRNNLIESEHNSPRP